MSGITIPGILVTWGQDLQNQIRQKSIPRETQPLEFLDLNSTVTAQTTKEFSKPDRFIYPAREKVMEEAAAAAMAREGAWRGDWRDTVAIDEVGRRQMKKRRGNKATIQELYI